MKRRQTKYEEEATLRSSTNPPCRVMQFNVVNVQRGKIEWRRGRSTAYHVSGIFRSAREIHLRCMLNDLLVILSVKELSLLKNNINPHLLHRFSHIGFFRGQLSKNNCVHVVVSIVLYVFYLFFCFWLKWILQLYLFQYSLKHLWISYHK